MRLSTEWNVMNHIFGVRKLLVFSKYLSTIVLRRHTLFSNHNTYHVYITWLSEAKVHIQTEWNICVHISLMQLYFLIECLLSKNIKVFRLLDLGIGNPIIHFLKKNPLFVWIIILIICTGFFRSVLFLYTSFER